MSRSTARPLDPELLGFLQTLVNEAAGQQERTDSDKENETGLNTITEEDPSVAEQEQSREEKMQQENQPTSNGDKGVWDDFFDPDEFKKKEPAKEEESLKKPESPREYDYSDDKFESLDRVDEEEEDDHSRSHATGDDDDSKKDSPNGTTQKPPAKKRKKRLFKRVTRPAPPSAPTATGGSHPDLGRHDRDRDRHSNQLETMSDTSGRNGRRLSRRKQCARPRVAGPAPKGDILEQKYQELHELLCTRVIDTGPIRAPIKQDLRRLHGQHIIDSLPPAGTNGRVVQSRQAFVELGQENSESGYMALRTVQTISNVQATNRPRTAVHRQRTDPSQQGRPYSAGNQRNRNPQLNGRNQGTENNMVNGNRGRAVVRKNEKKGSSERNNSGSVKNSARSYSTSSVSSRSGSEDNRRNRSGSGSRSPDRTAQLSDTHLKYSNNPALRMWLIRKNKEHRKQKAEERKKQREERKKKQEEESKRQEYFKDSDEKVKEWMKKKRKEAVKRAREDRKRLRQEEQERFEESQRQDQLYLDVFKNRSPNRPQSAQTHSDKKMFIPVIRPETAGGQRSETKEKDGEQASETVIPQPPPTKFVYKRPVSGNLKLMKLQKERKEDAKRTELEKQLYEKKLAEEKAKKMRMSYDQWLVKKREDDYKKRQEAARQRALAKSDPELERIVPEVARRRIENIQRGKKRVDTGIRKLNEEINKSFGGGDFDQQENGEGVSTQATYRLEVSGSQKSLKERPSSAKPALNPRISKSPRRPKSANPRVQALLKADENGSAPETAAFKLPFPPEKGVPKHVAARQKKLFSASVTEGDANVTQAGATDVGEQQVEQETDAVTQETAEAEPSPEATQEDNEQASGEDMEQDDTAKTGKDEESFFVTHGNLGDSKSKEDGVGDSQEVQEQKEESERQDGEQEVQKGEEEVQEEQQDNKADDVEQTSDQQDTGEEQAEEPDVTEESQQGEETAEIQEAAAEPVEQSKEETVEELENKEENIADEQAAEEVNESQQIHEEVNRNVQEITNIEDVTESKEHDGDFFDTASGDKSEVSESKSIGKHVSFQEEAIVFEEPDLPDESVEFETADVSDDEAEDERGGYSSENTPRDDDF